MRTADFAVDPVFAGADPPNAALVADVAGEEVVAVVELTNPSYDATAGTVRYTAVSVPGGPGRGLMVGERPVAEVVPEQFGPASLFIDSVSCQPKDTLCNVASDCCSCVCYPFTAGVGAPRICA